MILSKNRKNSRTSARKAAVSLLMIFVSGMFFMMPQTAHADAWGANMAAAIMKQTMEQIARQIEGALLGSLKMAAVQMLNNQVGQLIGGGAGGQARFITSFDDFLYRRPQQRTDESGPAAHDQRRGCLFSSWRQWLVRWNFHIESNRF